MLKNFYQPLLYRYRYETLEFIISSIKKYNVQVENP